MPAVKKPVSLMLDDSKRPDGSTLFPWFDHGLARETNAESRIANTATTSGAAAHRAAQKTEKILGAAAHTSFILLLWRQLVQRAVHEVAMDMTRKIDRRTNASSKTG